MAAIRNTGKEHGQLGSTVKDIKFPMVAIRSTKNTTQAMGIGSKGIFTISKCLFTVATDATKFNFVCLKW